MEERKQKLKTLALLGIVLTLLTIFSVTSFIAGRISTFGETSSVDLKEKLEIAVGLFVPSIEIDKLYGLINEYRKANGLNELKIDKRLEQSAKLKTEDMINRNYWSHQDPEGNFAWHYIAESGYDKYYQGENLAMGYFTAEAVFNGWKLSPKHNEVMLEKNARDFGINSTLNEKTKINYITLHVGMTNAEYRKECLINKCYRDWKNYKTDYENWKKLGIQNIQQQLDDWYSKFVK